MTTSSSQSTFSHNTDAEFRAWGKAVSDAVWFAGLTRTSDTGQIDWNTAVRAPANSMAGYEMYRFNDPLQATAPVFIRLEYRTGSSTNRPHMYMVVGSATDGAGNMVGMNTGQLDISYSASATPPIGTYYPTYACTMPGYVAAMLGGGVGSSAAMFFFAIERFRDDSGAATNEGVAVFYRYTGAVGELRLTTPASWQLLGNQSCLVPGGVTNAAVGNEVQLFRHYFLPVGRVRGINGICTHMLTDFGQAAEFTVEIYPGDPHTYLALGNWTQTFSTAANTSHCAAIRFEA